MNVFHGIKRFFFGSSEDEPATTSREGSNRGKRQHKSSLDAGGRGFKSTVAVPVAQEPVLQSAGYGTTGGVQGLTWYAAGLRQDKDGDYAHEFISADAAGSRATKKMRKRPHVAAVADGNVVLLKA